MTGCDTVRCYPDAGLSVPDQGTFLETIAKSRAEGFGDEVQKRILLGTYAVTTEAWDSFYMSAIAARFALVQQVAAQWSGLDLRLTRTQNENGVDIMVHPTSLRGAPRLSDNPAAEYAQDVLTTWGNLVGAPVLSAPAAQMLEDTDGARLPIGMSFAAQWGRDDVVLHVVHALQKHTDVLAARPVHA